MSTLNASGGAENLEEKICAFLKRKGAVGLKALEIAKGVGLTKAKDVNKALYDLQKAGRLRRSGETPPLWSLAGPCGSAEGPIGSAEGPCVSAEGPGAPSLAVAPSKDEIKTILRSLSGRGGVTAKKLARELNQPSKAVNAQLYDMLTSGEVEKTKWSKDDPSLWSCTEENGHGHKKAGSSDNQNDSVVWTTGESSDSNRLMSHLPVSRFSEEYSSIQKLDEGGFGDIYKAKQNLDKTCYAIKVVKYDVHALREVEALAQLQHPNIVRYSTTWKESSPPQPTERFKDEEDESDEEDGSESSNASFKSNAPSTYLYIQMEFCGGGTLTGWINKKNHEEARGKIETLDIFQEIVGGVEYIHSKGHIHRDLKPDNILFGSDGTVKIGDFGLVTKIKDKNGAAIERTKRRGTKSYMSPEQENLSEYDEKVDIFPLGLIFFEILWRVSTGMERVKLWGDLRSGCLPEDFREEHTSEHALIKKMLSRAPQDRPGAKDIVERLNLLIGKQTGPLATKSA